MQQDIKEIFTISQISIEFSQTNLTMYCSLFGGITVMNTPWNAIKAIA